MDKFKVGVYVGERYVMDIEVEANDPFEAEEKAKEQLVLEFDVDYA